MSVQTLKAARCLPPPEMLWVWASHRVRTSIANDLKASDVAPNAQYKWRGTSVFVLCCRVQSGPVKENRRQEWLQSEVTAVHHGPLPTLPKGGQLVSGDPGILFIRVRRLSFMSFHSPSTFFLIAHRDVPLIIFEYIYTHENTVYMWYIVLNLLISIIIWICLRNCIVFLISSQWVEAIRMCPLPPLDCLVLPQFHCIDEARALGSHGVSPCKPDHFGNETVENRPCWRPHPAL